MAAGLGGGAALWGSGSAPAAGRVASPGALFRALVSLRAAAATALVWMLSPPPPPVAPGALPFDAQELPGAGLAGATAARPPPFSPHLASSPLFELFPNKLEEPPAKPQGGLETAPGPVPLALRLGAGRRLAMCDALRDALVDDLKVRRIQGEGGGVGGKRLDACLGHTWTNSG